jgi:hypothetical protein
VWLFEMLVNDFEAEEGFFEWLTSRFDPRFFA